MKSIFSTIGLHGRPLSNSRAASVQSTLCHTEKQSAEDTSPRERSTKFQPPCGIWSLVALLQLLEAGCQKSDVTKWVREPSHPALAGQALQVCSYPIALPMHCTSPCSITAVLFSVHFPKRLSVASRSFDSGADGRLLGRSPDG